MRKKTIQFVLPLLMVTLIFCTSAVSRTEAAPRKLALLVGIDNYRADIPDLKRDVAIFGNLNGSLDSKNLQRVLTSERYKFAAGDVRVLSDAESTQAGIIKAFEELIAKAQPGDVVVFMYSGHGDQVKDDNGDEADGYDEVFVPYDWNNNDDNSFLRDDEIQKLLADLTKKMTVGGAMKGNITIIVDSCHSGTISRGRLIAKGRGRSEAARSAGKGSATTAFPGSGYDSEKAKNYVLLSACQSDESAYETFGADDKAVGGALVFNLCKILQEDDINPNLTYKELFERTKIQVKADRNSQKQTPSIEGQVNWKLFDGQITPTLSLTRVTDFDAVNNIVTLNAGSLLGAAAGAKYTVYRPNATTDKPGEPVGEITVTSVEPTKSKATLSAAAGSTPSAEQLLGAPAVLTQLPEDRRFKVLLDGTGDISPSLVDKDLKKPEADPLEFVVAPAGTTAKIKGLARGAADAPPTDILPAAMRYDYTIQREDNAKGASSDLVLRRADDKEIARVPADKSSQLRKHLVREWRWQTLAGVSTEDANNSAEVELKIIPITVQRDAAGYVTSYQDITPKSGTSGQLQMQENDTFRLEIVNKTRRNLWVTVANLQPDGRLSAMFPYPDENGAVTQEENKVPANTTRKIDPIKEMSFTVAKPLGLDLYKVIATTDYVDFTPLLDPPDDDESGSGKGAEEKKHDIREVVSRSSRGSVSPLVNLLADASLGIRAGRPNLAATKNWYVSSVTVQTSEVTGKGAIILTEKGKNQ